MSKEFTAIRPPKGYTHNGTLPDGTELFSNHRFSVVITLLAEGFDTLISVGRRNASVIDHEEAEKVVRSFGVTELEPHRPLHRSKAAYFIVSNKIDLSKFKGKS